ncbi:uncharacterized protein LOC107267475 isoform X2 [Cephus cinctus]|uniref:Uncharacterized protein LOC107267475 isoform X2 n=1 Tax=Cephus cinctus TaxID=211228 RepID=A0AAJ7W1H7_CEPCN|nr:uncharacterized protein LOC107267475 isoform X2 [Cephus cinctus]
MELVQDTSKEVDCHTLTSPLSSLNNNSAKEENSKNHMHLISPEDQNSVTSMAESQYLENAESRLGDIEILTEIDKTLSMENKVIQSTDKKTEEPKESGSDDTPKMSESSDHPQTELLGQPSQPALAFTIDFEHNKGVDIAKYQNLFERFNARHRRNLSTSKVEIKSKKQLLSPNFASKQKAPSTHSEGYFSSDQEDDTKKKADQLSRKLKQLGSKSVSKAQSIAKRSESMSRSCTEDSLQESSLAQQELTRNVQPSREKLSLDLGISSNSGTRSTRNPQKSLTMNDLSRVQLSNLDVEKTNSVQYSPVKRYTKNIEYVEIDHEDQGQSNLEASINDLSEKMSNMDYLASSCTSNSFTSPRDASMHLSSISNTVECSADALEKTNLDVFNVSNLDAESDGAVSEAGTYTVHKDYTDEEKARMDIDKVFSVGILTEEESNESYVHSFKMSISRNNNTWISEWATQVAEHNSLPPPVGGSTARTPPMSPTKIPSPIHNRSQRLSRNRQEQSDSSLDTESYLHVKKNLGILSNQNTLIDSGGESDDDTSNSYNTPPHSSQRTPTHSALVRRGSLSEALFKRINSNDTRRSVRNYMGSEARSKRDEPVLNQLKSPNHVLACLQLRRNSSLDRKEYTSDTTESNTSRRNSLKSYLEDNLKPVNSPVLNRLRPTTPKLTNSPILVRKDLSSTIINSPVLERTRNLGKSSPQARNIGYFTCTENSPYMLRKSSSTTNYHEDTSIHGNKELSATTITILQNSPVLQRNVNIQRSSSNASIRNAKITSMPGRRSSFNNSDNDRNSPRGRFTIASDSSSETGEVQKSSAHPISSGIKLNRAFSIRRARLNCESDTTPNTTPEERRKRGQVEVKSAPCSARQQSHHRGRTSSVGASSADVLKKTEPAKPRAPSISRTDSGRFSMRTPKTVTHHTSAQRPNQKLIKEHKKSTRSNSTLTSKEVEFQNWKRRKNYDPMKAAAEGKKKIETSKKHHSIEDSASTRDSSVLRSASFHGTGAALSLVDNWSDNEELNVEQKCSQPPPPSCSPQLGSDSDFETSSYLQTTQNVMSAMSARITVQHPNLVDSGGESDDDTSHSLRNSSTRITHQPSDTESSDEVQPVEPPPISNTKYNRAFRGRLDQPESKVNSAAPSKVKTSPRESRGKYEPVGSVARTDSGLFCTKSSKSSNMNKPRQKISKVTNSGMTASRDVEMQNWKRRKSYDPMKAAMEGKRKAAGLAKRNKNINLSPSHVLRSQSFHGSVGLGGSDWSDEELVASADEASLY